MRQSFLKNLWLVIFLASTHTLLLHAQEQTKTVEQLQTELRARINHTLLSPHYQWQTDGMWIKRNQMPMAYARKSPNETTWKLRNGSLSRIQFTNGKESIFLQEGDSLFCVGQIVQDFDYWDLFIGSTIIGRVYFDGRILDGKNHPCGHIQQPVTDDMAVYLFFVYALPEPMPQKKKRPEQ